MGNWLNAGSLMLGFTALILPVIAIQLFVKVQVVRGVTLLFCGWLCTVLSLLFVITYSGLLVGTGDWSRLIDTRKILQFISIFFTSVACGLNAMALFFMIRFYE